MHLFLNSTNHTIPKTFPIRSNTFIGSDMYPIRPPLKSWINSNKMRIADEAMFKLIQTLEVG